MNEKEQLRQRSNQWQRRSQSLMADLQRKLSLSQPKPPTPEIEEILKRWK